MARSYPTEKNAAEGSLSCDPQLRRAKAGMPVLLKSKSPDAQHRGFLFASRFASRIESWCGRVDSNHHGIATASPSSWCVCQFRHDRAGCEAVCEEDYRRLSLRRQYPRVVVKQCGRVMCPGSALTQCDEVILNSAPLRSFHAERRAGYRLFGRIPRGRCRQGEDDRQRSARSRARLARGCECVPRPHRPWH
jgi:hypothetical protein